MVDAEDLKSFGHCDRVGSSPTIPTTLRQGFVWQAIKKQQLDVWLSWLEHYVHIVGVGGSSPPTSTTNFRYCARSAQLRKLSVSA